MTRLSNSKTETDVWIVTFNEPLYYGKLFVDLINDEPKAFCGVILLPYSQGIKAFLEDFIYRVRFYGWATMFKISLRRVWMSVRWGNVEKAARENGLKFYKASTKEEIFGYLEKEGARLCLAAVPFKVPTLALKTIKEGWINVHCGPLPRYAGRDAPFWCLLNNEKKMTVTVHYMAEDFDSGPIIDTASISNDGSPYFTQVERLFESARIILAKRIKTGYPRLTEATPQDRSKATYFPLPTLALGKKFRKRGHRFI
jgi:hypothetical protein